MKRIYFIILLVINGALMNFSFGQGLDIAELKIDTNCLKLGQQTVLKFSVSCSKNRKPIFPIWKNILDKKLDIISEGDVDTLTITDDKLKIRQELIVAKFNEDTIRLDSLVIPLVKGRDTIFIGSNQLLVYPILENVDLEKDIRDIKSPVEIPYDWREILPYALIIIGGVLIGLIIYFLIRIIQRRKKKRGLVPVVIPDEPKIPAHVIALEKLNHLKSKELWFTTDSKKYISDLTDVLREYISNRWDFDARESTSEEILMAEFILRIDHDALLKLKTIFGTSDFVKFAKANTGSDENKKLLDDAFFFVETTKLTDQEND